MLGSWGNRYDCSHFKKLQTCTDSGPGWLPCWIEVSKWIHRQRRCSQNLCVSLGFRKTRARRLGIVINTLFSDGLPIGKAIKYGCLSTNGNRVFIYALFLTDAKRTSIPRCWINNLCAERTRVWTFTLSTNEQKSRWQPSLDKCNQRNESSYTHSTSLASSCQKPRRSTNTRFILIDAPVAQIFLPVLTYKNVIITVWRGSATACVGQKNVWVHQLSSSPSGTG